MGTVICLEERRRSRAGGVARPNAPTFYVDLADPGTYLAAERVERLPVPVTWRPALLPCARPAGVEPTVRRARELGMPIVWPEGGRAALPRAMRVAARAVECGRAVEFVLAASRLAFCGGFDLEDPLVLAEAAAAAGLPLDVALDAAGSAGLDEPMREAGRFLASHGATTMPVLQAGRLLFAGEARLADAAVALRDGAQARRASP